MERKITLSALNIEFGSRSIPYAKLLETQEWMQERGKIIDRDSGICKKCGCRASEVMYGAVSGYVDDKQMEDGRFVKAFVPSHKGDTHLEVHHRYYVADKYPWQYPDDALITLCNWCHQEVHDTTVIPFYSHMGDALGYIPCHRCNGSGSFPEYSHVQSGVCFRCNGARYEELIGR